MEYKKYACRICSSNHIKEDGKKILCVSCGAIFKAEEETKKFAEEMSALADEIKAERVAALRQQLYEKATAEHIDSEAILPLCRELKTYLPNDFLASFYEVANGGTVREYIDFLNGIDPRESYPFIESVVRFTVKSLSQSQDLILPLYNLIEKTYKNTDTEKYAELQTLAEGEAEKVISGIYDVNSPRDAFIIYSSKDMEKVMQLVEYLEKQEIRCFLALRNLQHGRGAKANYEAALKTAMDYCTCVVFVSSKNSRNASCDALRVELPFLRKEDVRNAPAEYRRGNYTSIPMQYKKRRIEYMIETSTQTTAADRTVKEFFFGLEYCLTPDEVADRILAFDNEVIDTKPQSTKEIEGLRSEIEEIKKLHAAQENNEIKKLKKQLADAERRAKEAETREQQNQTYASLHSENKTDNSKTEKSEKPKPLAEAVHFSEENVLPEEFSENDWEIKNSVLVKYIGGGTDVIIPNNVTQIAAEAFKNCSKIRSITIPDHVTDIETGSTVFNRPFYGCSSLKKIVLGKGIRTIRANTFEGLPVEEITISNGVTQIEEGAFKGCSRLKCITLPDSVTSIDAGATVFNRPFYGCSSLKKIVLSKGIRTIKANTFEGLPMEEIMIPNGVTRIEEGAFKECKHLKSITLPDSVTTIDAGTTKFNRPFYGCSSLKSIVLGKGMQCIKAYTFEELPIERIVIPSGVTEIEEGAFKGCSRLKYIFLPESLTFISSGSSMFTHPFYGCSSLHSIVLKGSDKARFNHIREQLTKNAPDLKEIISLEEESTTLVLTDEDGIENKYEILDYIEYKKNDYVVLLPIDDSESAGEVLILKIDETGNSNEESYTGVDNEKELNAVFKIFKKNNEDYFNFS